MILVLLGTFPLSFRRVLVEIENLAIKGVITDEIIVQNGHTNFETKHMHLRPFIPLDDLLTLYDKADLIISQAGTGSIIKGLRKNKKIIGIARLAKYGEAVDDHQLELLDEFSKAGLILPWNEDENLETVFEKSKKFEPKPFISNNNRITDFLKDYINSI